MYNGRGRRGSHSRPTTTTTLAEQFQEEYSAATWNHRQGPSFTSILARHAALMVEATKTHLDTDALIELGGRLERVGQEWIDMLCWDNGGGASRDDALYRQAVANVVRTFSRRLINTVRTDARVSFADISGGIQDAHELVSKATAERAAQLRSFFSNYVEALCQLYHARHEGRADRAEHCALLTLQRAIHLGSWLDATVFRPAAAGF